MKKRVLLAMLAAGLLHTPTISSQQTSPANETIPGYTMAQRFTKEKLNHMLFSTQIDPHWF